MRCHQLRLPSRAAPCPSICQVNLAGPSDVVPSKIWSNSYMLKLAPSPRDFAMSKRPSSACIWRQDSTATSRSLRRQREYDLISAPMRARSHRSSLYTVTAWHLPTDLPIFLNLPTHSFSLSTHNLPDISKNYQPIYLTPPPSSVSDMPKTEGSSYLKAIASMNDALLTNPKPNQPTTMSPPINSKAAKATPQATKSSKTQEVRVSNLSLLCCFC